MVGLGGVYASLTLSRNSEQKQTSFEKKRSHIYQVLISFSWENFMGNAVALVPACWGAALLLWSLMGTQQRGAER